MGETPPFSPDRVPWREAFALPICLSGPAPAESGIAVRVRSTIKPYVLCCIFVCPSGIKTRTDDEWIVVSSVSEVMGKRDHGPLSQPPRPDRWPPWDHPKDASAMPAARFHPLRRRRPSRAVLAGRGG